MAAKNQPGDLVTLQHSKYKDNPVVTRRAYEQVWKGKNYTIKDTAEKAESKTSGSSS